MERNIKITPGLFGQGFGKSNRDYSVAYYWGKNQFNSSFPVSLVAYMHSRGLMPVYVCLGEDGFVKQSHIGGDVLFDLDPFEESVFYNYEAGYFPYDKFYIGEGEKIDLVIQNKGTNAPVRGLEVKLTAIPDSTTRNRTQDKYGAEIVVRPPTICFLACSICAEFLSANARFDLLNMLNGVPSINHWEEANEILPHYDAIEQAVLKVSNSIIERQIPLVLQPVWKTEGGKMRLAEDCLDVFVWSNLALLNLCMQQAHSSLGMSRFKRTIVWVYKMLYDYSTHGVFDYVRTIKLLSYNYANDKAFAVSGAITQPFLSCEELGHPRVCKHEIKNIILGGGQNFLRPERRFDAVLVNSPDIFD